MNSLLAVKQNCFSIHYNFRNLELLLLCCLTPCFPLAITQKEYFWVSRLTTVWWPVASLITAIWLYHSCNTSSPISKSVCISVFTQRAHLADFCFVSFSTTELKTKHFKTSSEFLQFMIPSLISIIYLPRPTCWILESGALWSLSLNAWLFDHQRLVLKRSKE